MINRTRHVLISIPAIVLIGCVTWLQSAPAVYALIRETDRDSVILDTPFYDPYADACGSQSGGGNASADYAGNVIISDGAMQLIKANQSIYEQAAEGADIPWQMIAAIHFKETSLKKENPDNGQGVYQFVDGAGGPYPKGSISNEEFLRQTILVAQKIRQKVASNYSLNQNLTKTGSNVDAVKDTFYSYNGRAGAYEQQAANLGYDSATQGFEGSPYVMNKADAQRDPSVNTTTWGQIKGDSGNLTYPANNNHGAFLLYGALAGITTNCTPILGDGTLAWPLAETNGVYVTDCFGQRPSRYHTGLDIAGPDGGPIRAAADGIVIFAGYALGYGTNYVVIQHDGMVTGYGHMSSRSVNKNDEVKQGDPIGTQGGLRATEGYPDYSTGSHLHFNTIPGNYEDKQAHSNPLQSGLSIPEGVIDSNRPPCN